MLFKILFWVFDFEDHNGKKLRVQTGFGVVFRLFFLCCYCTALFIGHLLGLQKSLVNGQQVADKVVQRFSADEGVLIRAFEGILKLFKRQGLNFFFNQIVELLSYIFVDFAVFSWFIEGLIAGAVDLGEHEVVCVGILIVLVVVQRLGLGQSGVVKFGVYKGQD